MAIRAVREASGIKIHIVCDHCSKRIERGSGLFAVVISFATMTLASDRLVMVHEECQVGYERVQASESVYHSWKPLATLGALFGEPEQVDEKAEAPAATSGLEVTIGGASSGSSYATRARGR